MTENCSINHTVTLKKEDFDYICRCCLSRNTIANIFQLKFHETFLVDIFKLFNTQIIWDDDLPKTICAACTTAILNFYKFKKMYDKSVATLENIARQSKETVKKKGLLLVSYEKLSNPPSLGEDVNNANSDLQNHKVSPLEDEENGNIEQQIYKPLEDVKNPIIELEDHKIPPLEEDVENANIELQKNVTTIQIIPQDSNELVENNNELLSRIYENHEILPLGDVENGDIKVEENQAIKEELVEESQNESQDHENINDSDNNPSTTILKETQKSDQTIFSTTKDKHKFTLPYFCKTCNKWIDGAGTHKHSTRKKVSHVCETCGKSYLQKAALKIHYRIHQLISRANGDNDEKGKSDDTTKQKRKYNYKCSCGETFSSSRYLSRHKKEKNHQDPLYKNCGICNKTISYRGYRGHMRIAHSAPSRERLFTCEYCGLIFTFKENLKRHTKIHTGEKPHVCEFCGKGFIQKPGLDDHRRVVHTGERPFVCDFCGKGFPLKLHMMEHRRLHTGEKPYLCDHCGKTFHRKLSYNNHLKEKHRDKTPGRKIEVQCKICNKFYLSERNLKVHMVRHQEKKYICTHCKKGFHTKNELDLHSTTHTGEKKFTCDLCGKDFQKKILLTLHRRIHTGVKPYSCKICFRTFRQNPHLVSHMRVHTGEKPFGCPYCDKSFAHITTRNVHVRSHTGERPYVCDVCSKGFYHSSSMTKHRQSHFKKKVGIKLRESSLNNP